MNQDLLALYPVVRGLIYIGLLLLVGTQVVRRLVRSVTDDVTVRDTLRLRLDPLPPLALAVLLIADLARGWLQLTSLLDPGDHITVDLIRNALLSGSWGHAWLLQTVTVAVTLVLVTWIGRRVPGAVFVALIATMLWGQTGMGHAAGENWPWPTGRLVDLTHLVGVGIWLGTLAVLLVVLLPVLSAAPLIPRLAGVIRRYSVFARTGAALVVTSGVTAALVYTGASIRALPESTWGRLLLFKLACMLGVLALGWYNWRLVTPALELCSPGCERRLRRAVIAEMALTIVMLAITAVLVASALPGEG